MTKGKKSRMTEDRFQKLDTMGFKWSIATLPKGTSSAFHGETLTPAEEKQPPPLSEEGRSVQGASHNDTVESTASLEGGEIISTSAELACNPKGETVELPSADATHFTEI